MSNFWEHWPPNMRVTRTVDRVTIEVEPMWSPEDRWEHGVVVTGWWKGCERSRRVFSSMDEAMGNIWASKESGDGWFFEQTAGMCDHLGCSAPGTVFYSMLERFSTDAMEWKFARTTNQHRNYQVFCAAHADRGSAPSAADSMTNLELIPSGLVRGECSQPWCTGAMTTPTAPTDGDDLCLCGAPFLRSDAVAP